MKELESSFSVVSSSVYRRPSARPRFAGSLLKLPLQRRVCVSLPLALLCFTAPLAAQDSGHASPGMHAGTSVHVSRALPADPHGEVEIAANPDDANQLVACSIVDPNDSPTSDVVTYASFDGGSTWKLVLRTKGQNDHQSWDPDCRYGPDHVLYSLSEGLAAEFAHGYDRIDRSSDGGKTWPFSTRAPHAERSFILVDNRPGPQHGWLYLYGLGADTGSIRVAYSTDGGKTFFSQVVPLESGFHDVNVGPGAILSDGTVVFPMPVMKHSPEDSPQGFRVQLPAEIRLVRLKFQRTNWPLKVETSAIAPWLADFEPNGSYYATLAVDSSAGPFRDRIYAVWEDRTWGRSQIQLAFSADKGITWSHPRFIDDDVPRPVGNTLNGPDDIHGTVAVNARGAVGVMWLDRRDYPDNLGWAVRFRASLDGGETFLPSIKPSNVDYEPGRNGRVFLFGDGDFTFKVKSTNTLSIGWFTFHGGHTMGLAADANGGFHPLWIADPNGVPQLWSTDITVDGDVVKNGTPDLADLQDASKLVRLEFLHRSYDLKTHALDFDLRLENAGHAVIRGPLKVRLLDVGSYMGDVTVPAGDVQHNVEGTIWDFTPLLLGEVFQPGQITKPLHVRLIVRGLDPFTQIGRFTFFETALATMTTKVLAGSIDSQKGASPRD